MKRHLKRNMDKEEKSTKGGRETGATGRSRSEQEGHRERARSWTKVYFRSAAVCLLQQPPLLCLTVKTIPHDDADAMLRLNVFITFTVALFWAARCCRISCLTWRNVVVWLQRPFLSSRLHADSNSWNQSFRMAPGALRMWAQFPVWHIQYSGLCWKCMLFILCCTVKTLHGQQDITHKLMLQFPKCERPRLQLREESI